LNTASTCEFPLAQTTRSLLRLAQRITGMESTFVTTIDWQNQRQKILISLNQGALDVAEGMSVDWHDSLCRAMFLSGLTHSSAIDAMVPQAAGAAKLGIKAFFAVPILQGEIAIGTMCGASLVKTELDAKQLECMQLIADALQEQIEFEREKILAQARAASAERDAADARVAAKRHAEKSEHMEQLANTDALTGLPNRRAFMARWEDELARSGRRHYPIGLLLLDADKFKTVNDTWGHQKGDAVLRAVGVTLSVVAKSPDVIARLGGDEFALVTTHADRASLDAMAANLQSIFAGLTAELGVGTTLSIGVVSSDDCPREKMLAEADKALYCNKDMGRNAASPVVAPIVS
jgi:diguanylate cyclase